MPRARSPNREKAYELWKKSKGRKKNKEIAEELGVSEKLISRWKLEDRWADKSRNSTFSKSRNSTENEKVDKREKKAFNSIIKSVDNNDELKENQKLFILYWMKNHNATQAYYRTHNCTYETAMVNGCKLLKSAKIRREIDKLKKIRNETLFLEPGDIVERYMKIAFADMTDFTVIKDNEVYVVNSNMMDGGLISEIKQTNSGISIKLENRLKALQWLADYFSMNPMDTHKIEYDKAVLRLREKELELKEF